MKRISLRGSFSAVLAAAALFFAPGAAHAVVNGTFTVTGGNQQQVAQSTIKLTNTATGQPVQVTSSTNGNKKTFGFILPDGNYTLTGTVGGQSFNQTFAANGNGAASGGFNLDGGALDPVHGAGVTTAQTPTVNGTGTRVAGGGRGVFFGGPPIDRNQPGTQNIFELGGGFGPLFNFERARVSYTGSVIGSGGIFNESSVDVMPDFQLWANYRPAGWNGIYLGVAADVAIPTEGAQTHAFMTSGGLTGMSMISPRDAMLTLQGRVGMRDPLLPGSIFAEAGIRIQDYRSTVRAFSGTSLFEQFATDRLVTLPTFGVGARVPLAKVFGMPALRPVAFDTEINFTPASNAFSMPGSNSFSAASYKLLSSVSWLAKLEYEFDCEDP
jgi:hypothetical protein